MRISNGISEMSFMRPAEKAVVAEKVYSWPVYNQGRVEKVQTVTKRLESNAVYAKPSPEEKIKILDLAREKADVSYTQRGTLHHRSSSIVPGALFDAFV